MKRKTRISRYVQLWGSVLIIGVVTSITAIGIVQSYRYYNEHLAQLRNNYIVDQKNMIRQEVERVVALVYYEKSQSEQLTKEKIKMRTYEAFSIAQNIYEQNRLSHSKNEIQKMILDALRPLRYADGKGYYFATDFNGVEILFADRPEMEGRNLLELQDNRGKYVIKDMVEIAKGSGEGFYEYHWTKPKVQGNDFKKISFIKRFDPYDWFIGTGLYVDDIEEQIRKSLSSTISRIRFGKEGYIFVNRLNGDALVSNGKVFSGTQKLWEVYDSNPEKMKKIFEKEYQASLKPEGDYIYYSFVKLSAPQKESPKASYIRGVPEWKWLIGAGLYLDDVEKDVAALQLALRKEIKKYILFSLLVAISVFVFFLLLFSRLSRNLRKDTSTLSAFFQKASFSNETIDRDLIYFEELDQMAETANKMLQDKAQAERALLASEQRFRDLTENSTDWIWEFDENEIFTYVSPRVKELLGYSPEELIGQSAFASMSSTENKKIKEEFFHYKTLRAPFSNLVHVNRHKNGRKVILEFSALPIIDNDGVFRGYRGIDRDITERTALEEQLRQSHKMEAIGTLAGGIAHDFNNILSAIVGYAELAKFDIPESFPAKGFIDEILKASDRARELVHHILSFSRKEPGELVPIQIGRIVEDAVKLLRATIPTTIEIQAEIDSACGHILANPTQLHQIVLNLCTNASHAMDEDGGLLFIKVQQVDLVDNLLINNPERIEMKPGTYIKLTVSDTGPGIDPHLVSKIFDPYFTTKATGKGSGIGLAVVQGIVKSFNGVLEVESVVGKGSNFHVFFPSVDREENHNVPDREVRYEQSKRNERILIVDDEEDVASVNQKRLQLLGYNATACLQADEALALLRAEPLAFDLIITDQSMPIMTGEQLANEILKIRPDLPIIMCTGYSSKINAEKAALIGIKAFLMKPVDFEVLSRTVQQVLNMSY